MIRRDLRVAAFLAARSVTRGNAGVTSMAIAMVAAVFVSIMFLPSLITGASTAIEAQITDTLTGDLVITGTDGSPIDNADDYIDEVRATAGVSAATPLRIVGNQIAHGEDFNAWTVAAIDPVSYAEVFITPEHLIEGQWLQSGDVDGIVLGVGIAGAEQTNLRTYSQSLKTVHAGDEVEVTLLGGTTKTFTVRGIYANDFALTDQNAYITLAAADSAIPETNPADQIGELFDGLDAVGKSLDEASEQAAALSDGLDALAEASDSLAGGASEAAGGAASLNGGATDAANGASSLSGGASDLDAAAASLNSGAHAVAEGAAALATNAQALADTVSGIAVFLEAQVPVATAAANQAAAVAASAQAAVEACPDPTSAYCQQIADLAAAAGSSAAAAATVDQAVSTTSEHLSAVADQAVTLASGAVDLATAAASLADGANTLSASSSTLADSSASLAAGSRALADSSASLSSAAAIVADSTTSLSHRTVEVAAGTSGLADALDEGAASIPSVDESDRDDLLGLFDSAGLPTAGSASTIVVTADESVTTEDLITAIRPLSSDVEFQTPEQLSLLIQDQLDTFSLIDSIMRVISLLVAAITVFIITYVDLNNRRRQIGIERAIGIRSTSIVTSYVFKSILTGIVGSVVGFVVFRFVIVPIVDRFPFMFPNGPVTLEVSQYAMLVAAGILLVVSAVSAVIPAIQTVRMRILDAIWG